MVWNDSGIGGHGNGGNIIGHSTATNKSLKIRVREGKCHSYSNMVVVNKFGNLAVN